MFKIGSQLFTAEGPAGVERLAHVGPAIFLDLKFHDIPNTVAGSVAVAARLTGVGLISLHALGGAEMLAAAVQGRDAAKTARGALPGRRPALLAITVLTSMDSSALRRVGVMGSPGERALGLARLAKRSGVDGVVASPRELRAIRRACGRDFLIVTPGIRPGGAGAQRKADDQARVASPAEAIEAGADYIVVGRPITAAADPRSAALAIVEEIAHARRRQV